MKSKMGTFAQKNGAWIGLFGLSFIFLILTHGEFGSARNLTNLLLQATINGILAAGMTLVIITSGIDLSVGSLVAITGIVAGIAQLNWHFIDLGYTGAWLSVGVAVLVGLACGAISGLLTALLGVNPFIITLGMMVIARGGAMILSGGATLSPMSDQLGKFSDSYLPRVPSLALVLLFLLCLIWVNRKQWQNLIFPALLLAAFAYAFYGYRGLPVFVVFLVVVAALSSFWLNSTVFGRSIYAIGSNQRAAYWAGVRIKRTLFWVYTIMGAFAGLAGVLLCSRLNSADPNAGNLFELDAIAAAVIGGTSLRGGSGTVTGSLIGALIMAALNNGMDLLGISSFYQMVLKGVIIIVAVALDSSQRQKI